MIMHIDKLLVLAAFLIVSAGCGGGRCTPDAGCNANQSDDGSCREFGGPNSSKCDGSADLF